MEPTCQNSYQHKKGTCRSCSMCIKCLPSDKCSTPNCHSPGKKRGRPPSTDTTPTQTPPSTSFTTPTFANYGDYIFTHELDNNTHIVTHELENHPHIPEILCVTDPKRAVLDSILKKLDIPLQLIQYIPIDGIDGVSDTVGNQKRTLKRAFIF